MLVDDTTATERESLREKGRLGLQPPAPATHRTAHPSGDGWRTSGYRRCTQNKRAVGKGGGIWASLHESPAPSGLDPVSATVMLRISALCPGGGSHQERHWNIHAHCMLHSMARINQVLGKFLEAAAKNHCSAVDPT